MILIDSNHWVDYLDYNFIFFLPCLPVYEREREEDDDNYDEQEDNDDNNEC